MQSPTPESSSTVSDDRRRLRRCVTLAISFAAVLWSIKLVEVLFGLNLAHLGVYPQRLSGLIGILFAPLIHGSVLHLVANTAPIVILGTVLLYGYPRSAKIAIPPRLRNGIAGKPTVTMQIVDGCERPELAFG